jgi:hypothetical protein
MFGNNFAVGTKKSSEHSLASSNKFWREAFTALDDGDESVDHNDKMAELPDHKTTATDLYFDKYEPTNMEDPPKIHPSYDQCSDEYNTAFLATFMLRREMELLGLEWSSGESAYTRFYLAGLPN